METIRYGNELMERLNRLTHEVIELKAALIRQVQPDKEKGEAAWKDLMLASKEISRLWKGPSAVAEIRDQRGP